MYYIYKIYIINVFNIYHTENLQARKEKYDFTVRIF